MDHIVHHAASEAIGQQPSAASENPYSPPPAPYQPWTDAIWRSSDLRPGISARLARIDRALQGLSLITELLAQSFNDSQTEDEQPARQGMPAYHLERLHAAAWTLHETAESAFQQLRDNEFNCWGRKS